MAIFMRKGTEILGWLVLPSTVLLTGRLVWEQTSLTWHGGPQMVGFTLTHVYGAFFLVGLLSHLISYIWLLVVLIQLLRRKVKVSPRQRLLALLLLVAAVLMWIPYGTWQWLAVKVAGPGPQGEQLLGYAVATGERRVAAALLDEGINVNSTGYLAATPLHLAARSGDENLVRFLLSRGADRNARDARGRIPADWAREGGHEQIARLLAQ